MCLLVFHPAKKLETVNTLSANVTSLLLFQRLMTKLILTSFVFMNISICAQALNKYLKFS